MHLWPGGDAVHAPTPLAPPSPSAAAAGGDRARHGAVDPSRDAHPARRRLAPGDDQAGGRAGQRDRRADRRGRRGARPRTRPARRPSRSSAHGVPDALLAPVQPAQEHATAVGLDLPDAYVLAVGTVEPRKGLDVLVAAMAKPYAPDLPLVVVGPHGWGEVDLTALARRARPARRAAAGARPDQRRRPRGRAAPGGGAGRAEPGRGLRAAGARGDGARRAGGALGRAGAGRGGRRTRRGRCRGGDARRWPRRCARCSTTRRARAGRVAQGQLRAEAFTWEHAADASCGGCTRGSSTWRTSRYVSSVGFSPGRARRARRTVVVCTAWPNRAC